MVLAVSLADAEVMLCKADISCLYAYAMRSSLDTVPSPFVSIGSVDDDDDLVDEVDEVDTPTLGLSDEVFPAGAGQSAADEPAGDSYRNALRR